MSGNLSRLLAAFGIVALIGFSGFHILKERMPEMLVRPVTENTQKIRVLFVGNSYTYYNNMPGMLAQIARSDRGVDIMLDVHAVARGGSTLTSLWAEGQALHAIVNHKWDYVVLQEQSFWAMHAPFIRETTQAVTNFHSQIEKTGAKTLLFATWPRKPGSLWYTDPQYSFLISPEHMQTSFSYYTAMLAKSLGVPYVPVGDYWYYVLSRNPQGVDLYMPDGTHPSPAGSYLAALIFYKQITGRTPDGVTYTPEGLNPVHARTLRRLVSSAMEQAAQRSAVSAPPAAQAAVP